MTPTPTATRRYTPADRKAAILSAAVALAELEGYGVVTLMRVATAANVSYALVSHNWQGADQLRTAVMEEAVRCRVLRVVAEGLAHRHPAAIAAPASLKQAAVATLTGGEA